MRGEIRLNGGYQVISKNYLADQITHHGHRVVLGEARGAGNWRITMHRFKRAFLAVAAAVSLVATTGVTSVAQAGEWPTEKQCKAGAAKDGDNILKGWCVAVNRRGGNCLACHQAMVNPWPEGFPPGGNIAPPLVAMAARYPNREDLRAQIWDPTEKNPLTSMPPFGKHKLISEEDIDLLVDWLLSI
jgi:sulfur-oxidizing protein SoxX